ncbi:MAG: hypothetical protein Q7S29_05465 [Candidatus Peribacter sp.]|nr:hypothetical protein [Candidatus Peribacter sp.]
MVQTQIFLPYAMPGCMRRLVGHFRRHRLGSDLGPGDGNTSREHDLFNRVEWMEVGSHALEIPQYLCMGMRNPEIVSEKLLAHYGIAREIKIAERQFCAVAIGRFRLTAGKSVIGQQSLLIEDSEPVVYQSSNAPGPVVCAKSGRSSVYVTHLPPETNLPLADVAMKIESDLRPTHKMAAVIPRIHITRWDSYAGYLGLAIKGTTDMWTLGFAEAHTILTVEPALPDCVPMPAHVTEVRPPLLLWVRREGGHFEFPALVGILAAEDFA